MLKSRSYITMSTSLHSSVFDRFMHSSLSYRTYTFSLALSASVSTCTLLIWHLYLCLTNQVQFFYYLLFYNDGVDLNVYFHRRRLLNIGLIYRMHMKQSEIIHMVRLIEIHSMKGGERICAEYLVPFLIIDIYGLIIVHQANQNIRLISYRVMLYPVVICKLFK